MNMKTFLKPSLILGLSILVLSLNSCGDKNKEEDKDYASKIAGTYVGEDTGSDVTKKTSTKAIGATAIIRRESNDKVTIIYDNEGVTKSSATSYPSAKVIKEEDGVYNIRYDDNYIDMQINGIVEGNQLTLQRVMYGDIDVNFIGYK